MRDESNIQSGECGLLADAAFSLAPKISPLGDYFFDLWENTPDCFPSFDKVFTEDEQRGNESRLNDIFHHAFSIPLDRNNGADVEFLRAAKIKTMVRLSLAESMYASEHGLAGHFFDPWFDSALEFIKEARWFDPRLTREDIFQALRNIWICNSAQVFLGKPVALTPATYAYSLLYPYTDNYLDDPAIAKTEKEYFLQIVESMLRGRSASLSTGRLKKISRLIAMIAAEYPRARYPEVYESLLAIHRAQGDSLKEHEGNVAPEESDLPGISIMKGGTSVLADACLVAGTLDDDVAKFMFGFGAVLQFVDDLQDIAQDCRNRHSTIFTHAIGMNVFEPVVNRLFNFMNSVLHGVVIFPAREADTLVGLSLMSCLTLSFEAIARASGNCAGAYLRALEPYSPLRFDCLREMKKKIEMATATAGA